MAGSPCCCAPAGSVADRWHILRNLGDATRSIVERRHAVVRRVAAGGGEIAAKPHAAPVEVLRPTAPERRKQAAFDRRQARYQQAERLPANGLPLPDLAVRIGVGPRTLRRWRELGHAPFVLGEMAATPLARFAEGLEHDGVAVANARWSCRGPRARSRAR